MIALFRTIRQRLMTENKLSRYLLYAAGEIVLIVAGILIALQLDGWHQDRTDRALELDYMRSLVEDIEIDVALASEVLASLWKTLEGDRRADAGISIG